MIILRDITFLNTKLKKKKFQSDDFLKLLRVYQITPFKSRHDYVKMKITKMLINH